MCLWSKKKVEKEFHEEVDICKIVSIKYLIAIHVNILNEPIHWIHDTYMDWGGHPLT